MKLTENVVMLGNRHFNYFIAGKKEAAIVECGVTGSVVSLKTQWDMLQRRPDVRFLIIMHAHFDHVCGVPTLKELFPDAVVLASEKAKEALCKAKIINDFISTKVK